MGIGSVSRKGVLVGCGLIAVSFAGWVFENRPFSGAVGTTETSLSEEIVEAQPSVPVVASLPEQSGESAEVEVPVENPIEGVEEVVETVEPAVDEIAEYQAPEPVTTDAAEPEAEPVASEAEPVVAQETQPVVAQEAEEAVAAEAPVMETARIDADGTAIIAGRAAPNETVSIMVDDEVIDEVQTDGSGNYASIFEMDASDTARVVSVATPEAQGTQDLIVMPTQVQVTPDPVEEVTKVVEAIETEAETVVAMLSEETPVEDAVVMTETMDAQGDAEVTKEGSVEQVESSNAEEDTSDTPVTAEAVQTIPVEDAAEQEVVEQTPVAEPIEQAPAVLMTSKDGVKVVQAPVEKTDDVTLDAISYSDQGDVTLSGRASSETNVQVYVDNTLTTATKTDEDGAWETDLDNVDAGVYTLRIDEVDQSSQVQSRIELPFKREDREVLAQASDAEAADDAVIKNVIVQPGSTLWAIARERYGEGILYVQVFAANRDKIRDPDLIYPGQVFDLPKDVAE